MFIWRDEMVDQSHRNRIELTAIPKMARIAFWMSLFCFLLGLVLGLKIGAA